MLTGSTGTVFTGNSAKQNLKSMESASIEALIAKRKLEEDVDSGDASSDGENPDPKRPRTQEEKKLDRILANRRSARRSRERRKQLQENLEKSVILLTRQNEDLSRENDMLKQELRVLLNVFNGKRNLGTAPSTAVNFPEENLRNELLLRMAGSTGGVGSLIPDNRNTYVTGLASGNGMHQQPNRQLPELFSQAGAAATAGQQMFAHNNAGLFNGQSNAGMRH